MDASDFERIRVLVETAERSFKGYVYKPKQPDDLRLSDYLNHYTDSFLRLADVEITERGQHYRVGDKQSFVAVSVASIVYVTPLDDE